MRDPVQHENYPTITIVLGVLIIVGRLLWFVGWLALCVWLLLDAVKAAPLIERLGPGATHELLEEPLYEVEQISDVLRDGFAWASDSTTQGLTNGYSTYLCARGGWIFSPSTRPGQGMLYRDELGEHFPVKKLTLAESNTIRFVNEGCDVLLDHISPYTWLKRLNLNTGMELARADFAYNVEVEHHFNTDNAGRFQAFWFNNRNSMAVYDWQSSSTLPAINERYAAYEISPSGNWLRTGRSGRNRFWKLPACVEYVDCVNVTQDHSGWAWTTDGREVFVSKDSTHDYYYYFEPAQRFTDAPKSVFLFGHADIHYTNHHVATVVNPALRGWTLLSTYSRLNRWADNQLFFVELVAAEPRIIRLGHHRTRWGMSSDKTKDYFCEAFASIDWEGKHVYWASNRKGVDNLELVRMKLPDEVRELLGWQAAPTPTPTPDDEWRPVVGRQTEGGTIEFKLE